MTEGRPVWTSDKGSMAQETANSRWPKIVSGMIDDVEVEIAAWKDCLPRRAEGRAIVFRLHVLKEDIENDTVLRCIPIIFADRQSLVLTDSDH